MSATHAISTRNNSESQENSAENPWVTFFDAMQNAPRDEHWEEFMRVMKERPLNQLPTERTFFGNPE